MGASEWTKREYVKLGTEPARQSGPTAQVGPAGLSGLMCSVELLMALQISPRDWESATEYSVLLRAAEPAETMSGCASLALIARP